MFADLIGAYKFEKSMLLEQCPILDEELLLHYNTAGAWRSIFSDSVLRLGIWWLVKPGVLGHRSQPIK